MELIENNLRFPGQYFDVETGLLYNWNRYYEPATGRYISADPTGLNGGINLFAYVGGDPVNWIDPEGLHKGDKWYGYNNKDFHKWFHRCWKEEGNPDADKDEIEEAYAEWVRSGKPKGGKCGSPPPGEPDPEPVCGDNCKKIFVAGFGIVCVAACLTNPVCAAALGVGAGAAGLAF